MNRPTSFLYEHDEGTGIATLTLNRPERMNALTFEVYDEMPRTIRSLNDAPAVRAIVLTGAGDSFCSGGDVHDIIGPLPARDYRGLLEFTRMTCDVVLAMRQCPEAARSRALVMARGPSFALDITKDALNREASMDLASALEAEAQIQASLMLHPDFREAYEAFRDKRPARFQ